MNQATTQTRPILFLDVDGVLNPLGSPAGHVTHLLDGFPILLNPADGPALLELAADFELVWATTWEDDANHEIGTRLGLPILPVVHFTGSIKWPDVVAFARSRPFAWLEDDIGEREMRLARERHLRVAPTLLVQVDYLRGLQEADLAAVRRFGLDCRAVRPGS